MIPTLPGTALARATGRGAGGPRCARAEAGMVTAELATALPVLLLVLVLGLGAVDVAAEHLACGQALRVAARHLARGESEAQVHAAAAPSLPSGARLDVSIRGALASVTVVQPSRSGPLGLALPGCSVSAVTDVENATATLGLPGHGGPDGP